MDFILRLDTLDWIVNNCKFVQIQNLKPTQEQLIQNKQDENKHLAVFFIQQIICLIINFM